MTIGERIRSRRKELGLTVDELAEKLGKNRATIYRYESNEIEKLPTTVLEPLAAVLNVTPAYLMGWKTADERIEPNAVILPENNIRMIPVFDSVAAGFGAYADDHIIDYMPIYIVGDNEASNTIIINVKGNSMYPKIEDGDSIQVLRQDWAESGQVAVIMIGDENSVVVKKIVYDHDKETAELISFNPEYAPRVFKGPEIEDLRILGVVKKVIKEL